MPSEEAILEGFRKKVREYMGKREEAKEMSEKGAPVDQIALELDVAQSTIYRWLRETGAEMKDRVKSVLDKLTPAQRQDITERWLGGSSAWSLIQEFGLNYNAFYRLMREEGVEYDAKKDERALDRTDRMDTAVKMYEGGEYLWKIKLETGVYQPALHEELHKRGIVLRRARR